MSIKTTPSEAPLLASPVDPALPYYNARALLTDLMSLRESSAPMVNRITDKPTTERQPPTV
jgi:hypothetical protein